MSRGRTAPPMVTRSGLAKVFSDVALATMLLAFAYAHLRAFLAMPRASIVFITVFEVLFAIFLLVRRSASSASTSLGAWVSTIAGTFTPLLFRPSSGQDFLPGQIVQLVGLTLGLAGILSLNRSVGLLPANRGVRTGGAYRFVRHPLYSAYTIMHLGYLASHPTGWNVAIFVAALGAQLARIRREEQLLLEDPAYVEYATRTRWRLLPLIF